MKTLQRFAYPVILAYLWVMMILLGSMVMETFMIYPNVFHDPPGSLALAMEFLAVSGPSDYFPPLGFLSWATGAGALILGWGDKSARCWIGLSLLLIVIDGLFSMLFFWPRNTIMFVEGTALHSAETLRQTARKFQALHWARLALNAASAVAIFVGFLAFYRHRTLAKIGCRDA